MSRSARITSAALRLLRRAGRARSRSSTSWRVGRSWLVGTVRGTILILACLVIAYLVANLVDVLRPGTLLQGRGFRPTAVMAAAFVTTAGFWWFLARRHGWAEMLGSLVLVEALLVALLRFFSGSAALDSFFLDWFLGVNLYVGFPWLLAIGLSLVLRRAA